jgi:hypothetical protein
VRSAARDGVVEALQTQTSAAPKLLTPPPLLDKRALAHALGVSTAQSRRRSHLPSSSGSSSMLAV